MISGQHASYTLLKVLHDGMSWEIAKLMQIPINTLCYLIKLMPLFPSCVIYSPFVALSVFAALSNFSRIIKLLPSWGFKLFFSGFTLVWWFHKTSHRVKLSAGHIRHAMPLYLLLERTKGYDISTPLKISLNG